MRLIETATLIAAIVPAGGCAIDTADFPPPHRVVAPQPIPDASGPFVSPYTSDGVLAEWVDQAVNADTGAFLGGAGGAYAGMELAGNDTGDRIAGAIIGLLIGMQLGRDLAIRAAGGWEGIRATSDLSFHDGGAMLVWMYAEHGDTEHYDGALRATFSIYPDLRGIYARAIRSARLRPPPPPPAAETQELEDQP